MSAVDVNAALFLIRNQRRTFFFHYNKPASRTAGKPVISVHWCGRCVLVDNVDCRVPVKGRIKKRQPYFVMVGHGVVRITNNIAVITNT